MAQQVVIAGAMFNDVPAVSVPDSNNVYHSFTDVSDTTAAAADVASGKYFYTSAGVRTAGTSSGGGGGSNWVLLASKEFTVNTSSTSNTSVGTIDLPLTYDDPETVLWVHIRDKAGPRSGYSYGSDSIFFHYQLANGFDNSLSTRPVMSFSYNSNNYYTGTASYYSVYSYRLNYTASKHYVEIYSRYNSSYGTINGTFKCDVYKLTMPTGMTLFEIPTT